MTGTRYPLPAPARGIYFATELDPTSTAYTTAELVRFSGAPQPDLLRQALTQVYAENEGLRAVFTTGQDSGTDEGPNIYWAALSPLEHLERIQLLEEIDLGPAAGEEEAEGAVRDWAANRMSRPLEVLSGSGVDSALITTGDTVWFYHAVHHLLADGFAAYELLRRTFALYRELEAGQEPECRVGASLADLAEQDAAEKPLAREQTRAYREKLASYDWGQDPSLEIVGGQNETRAALRARATIPVQVQEDYRTYGRQIRASWPQLMVTALGAYLGRSQGVEHFRALVPQMNRILPGLASRPCAKTAVTAVNLLPVLCPAHGQAADMVAVVGEGLQFNADHALAPYEELEATAAGFGASLGGAQINVVPFDDALNCGQAGTGQVLNLAAGPVPNLTLTVRGMPHRGRPLSLEVDAHPNLALAPAIRDLANRLVTWLENWVQAAQEASSIDEVPLAAPAELDQLTALQGPNRSYSQKPLAAVFDSLARQHPDRLALLEAAPYQQGSEVPGGRQLTYGQLRSWALALAAQLQDAGVGAGSRVALRGPRSLEYLVAVYALLYTGAVYVPLEPSLPADRTEGICQDAGVELVLHTTRDVPGLAELKARGYTQPASVPGLSLPGTSAVYTLFTSGSTGKPKGVEVRAESLINRLSWQQELLALLPGERVLYKTPTSFDVHIWELYWAQTVGASTVLCAPEGHRDPAYLAGVIVEDAVDLLHFVPSMLAAFTSSRAAAKTLAAARRPRAIICSGEALDASLVTAAQQLTGAAIHNFYGPTEAAIDVTSYSMNPGEVPDTVPLGRPVANTVVTVRDKAGQPCPPLTTGELYLQGVQVSSGYLNRPEATAAAFSIDPELGPSYATGDLVQWGSDGQLYYRGRADHQVKIRGQRVELAEIEAVVTSSSGVQRACVIYRKDGALDHLLAFLQPKPGTDAAEVLAQARASAQAALSDYMVPDSWLTLAELPLTVNGKVDRAALARMEVQLKSEDDTGLPESLTVERYCRVFSRVLGAPVSPDTDFFAAGGHSLLALSLIEALEAEFGRSFSLLSVFKAPTPASLALAEEQEAEADYQPCLTLRSGSGAPIIFLPPAGGLSWCYSSLVSLLPAGRPVLALQAENYSGADLPAATSIAELAGRYLQVLEQMFSQEEKLRGTVLIGWSLGGMVAQELAYRLETRGLGPERVLLLDAYPQAHWRSLAPATEKDYWLALARMGGLELGLEQLTETGVLAALKERGSALASLPDQHLNTCLEQIRQAMQLVRVGQPQKIRSPLFLLVAQETLEKGVSPSQWLSFAENLWVVEVVGGHADMVKAEKIQPAFKESLP